MVVVTVSNLSHRAVCYEHLPGTSQSRSTRIMTMQTKCSRSAEYVTEHAIIEAEINRDHLDVVLPTYLESIGTAEAEKLLSFFKEIQSQRKPIQQVA